MGNGSWVHSVNATTGRALLVCVIIRTLPSFYKKAGRITFLNIAQPGSGHLSRSNSRGLEREYQQNPLYRQNTDTSYHRRYFSPFHAVSYLQRPPAAETALGPS